MKSLTKHTHRGRTFVVTALLAVAFLVATPSKAHAEEETTSKNPFTQIHEFAQEIHAYVSDVADDAVKEKEEQERKEALEKKRSSVVSSAKKYLGVPYVYGGTTPSGFDCSGFTRYVFKEALGMSLPRTAQEQSSLGTKVSLNNLQVGDLLFWGGTSSVYHVGIYVGNGEYIHASTGGGKIMKSTFDYFKPSFAKRVLS
jgi:cell wall-associated NlpC family hydrolase